MADMKDDHSITANRVVDAILIACRRKDPDLGVGGRPAHARIVGKALDPAMQMGTHVLGRTCCRLFQMVALNISKIALSTTVKDDPQAHGLLSRSSLSASTRFSPRLASASAGSSTPRSSSESM